MSCSTKSQYWCRVLCVVGAWCVPGVFTGVMVCWLIHHKVPLSCPIPLPLTPRLKGRRRLPKKKPRCAARPLRCLRLLPKTPRLPLRGRQRNKQSPRLRLVRLLPLLLSTVSKSSLRPKPRTRFSVRNLPTRRPAGRARSPQPGTHPTFLVGSG